MHVTALCPNGRWLTPETPGTCYRVDFDDMKFTPENFGDVNFTEAKVPAVALGDVKLVFENFGDSDLTGAKLSFADFGNAKPTAVYLTGVDRTGVKVGDTKPVPVELAVTGADPSVWLGVESAAVPAFAVDAPGRILITTASSDAEVDDVEPFVPGLSVVDVGDVDPRAATVAWVEVFFAEVHGVVLSLNARPDWPWALPSQNATSSKAIVIRLISPLLQLLFHDLPFSGHGHTDHFLCYESAACPLRVGKKSPGWRRSVSLRSCITP